MSVSDARMALLQAPITITVEAINERVALIAAVAGDDEVAHSEEDELHQAVLQAIADGTCDDPAGCARAALKTKELEFARWCA